MVQVILERQNLEINWTIKFLNGIEFEHNNLTLGEPGEQFKNRRNERFLFIGSLNVENETLTMGVHYLLKGQDESVWMILKENFDRNFIRVNK